MGCSAAKNVAVAPIETNGVANKERDNNRKSTATLHKDTELHPGEVENAIVNNVQKAGSGMSFEIMFDENEDKKETVVQKQPPKRILELQESENREPITLEKLQEKLEDAEIRRQQILQQRIQSANLIKKINPEKLQPVENEDDRFPNHLKAPIEVSPPVPKP